MAETPCPLPIGAIHELPLPFPEDKPIDHCRKVRGPIDSQARIMAYCDSADGVRETVPACPRRVF